MVAGSDHQEVGSKVVASLSLGRGLLTSLAIGLGSVW